MLLKTDEQKLNMINITKRKLMTLANGAECLSSKIDNWVTSNNNYRKLRSSRLSKSCQTMIDHPPSLNTSSYWSYEDTLLLENWIAEKPETCVNEKICEAMTEELVDEPCCSVDENSLFENNKENIIQPIIRMDGDFIEIEYYCEEDDNDNDNVESDSENSNNNFYNIYVNEIDNTKIENKSQEIERKIINRNDNSKHNTPTIPSRKIVDTRGLSPRRSSKYREFLVKYEDNNNSPIFNDKLLNTEESNSKINENNTLAVKYNHEFNTEYHEFDDHRPLSQLIPEQKNNLIKHEQSIMYERGGSTRVRSLNNEIKSEIKSFLSFRCPNKKSKSEKKIRKKYVTSEEGAAGPIWPAVLLTYDRGVTSGPPDVTSDE